MTLTARIRASNVGSGDEDPDCVFALEKLSVTQLRLQIRYMLLCI